MAESTEVNNFHPGAAKFGNFINYYQFNSAEKRLDCIPSDLLLQLEVPDNVILDVGCNIGDLTSAIYKHFSINVDELHQKRNYNINVIAVDLDPILIQRANEANAFPQNIVYHQADFTNDSQRSAVLDMLKPYGKRTFDIACCFSITMWIHLNHGDVGLQSFLRNVSSMAEYLLIEPQNWKCYRNASRRMRRACCTNFQNLELLTMNTNVVQDIVNYLQKECKMEPIQTFGESQWGREIMLFKKT